MAPQVGAVGQALVIDFKDDIVDGVDVLEIGTVRDIIGDLHDATVIVGNADFLLGAAHAAAHVACEGSGRDLDLTDLGADLGKGGLHAYSDIRRAADDVHEFIRADIHLQEMELFTLGMILDRLDLGDDDSADVRALELYIVLYLGGRKRKLIDQFQLVESRKIDKVLDPIH